MQSYFSFFYANIEFKISNNKFFIVEKYLFKAFIFFKKNFYCLINNLFFKKNAKLFILRKNIIINHKKKKSQF